MHVSLTVPKHNATLIKEFWKIIDVFHSKFQLFFFILLHFGDIFFRSIRITVNI